MPRPEITRPTSTRPSARVTDFLTDELGGGVVLAAATVTALLWANLAPGTYADVWATEVGPAAWHLRLSLHTWVNDGLMALFFFVVGLEIKRELVVGELSRLRDAAVPLLAALGGMAVPALIYLAWNAGGDGGDGWAIPMATDIAFVLGALALLGRRAPVGLRLFLLAVAIVDDIGGIAVIALVYSSGVDLAALGGAALVALAVVAARRAGVVHPLAYVPLAVALWWLTHESGVHATLAGVVLGLLTPARGVERAGEPVGERLERRLHPASALVAVPLFALANAGVAVDGDALRAAAGSPVAWGVLTALVVGKTVGIAGAGLLAVRLGVGQLPSGVRPAHLVGGAALAGIGFTVALFITELAFDDEEVRAAAKLAVLLASALAGLLGAAFLVAVHRRSVA